MTETNDEKLVVTPLNSSKELSQVLANDTCRSILDALADEALSASQVSEKLDIPLSTADYNIKKLEAVDLITVSHKKWSSKGNKVNYYAPRKKFIVLAPGSLNTRSVLRELKGLIPVIGIAAVISGAVEWFTRPVQMLSSVVSVTTSEASKVLDTGSGTAADVAPSTAADVASNVIADVATTAPEAVAGAAPSAAPAVSPTVVPATPEIITEAPRALTGLAQTANPHYGLWLFLIAVIAILLYALYRSYKK